MIEPAPSPFPTRRTRLIAWIVILAIAAYQAYAQRFVIGPDGISYLDLSDAVTTGEWGRLLNLYWSPLYPLLVGIARVIARATPASEIPVVHATNFVLFVGMFATFEYMLMSIYALAQRTPRALLAYRWAPVVVYVLFGCFTFTMIPLELTTPDLLSGASVFLAFGAMLRLRAGSARSTRDAIVLGLALGLGALAKSFMVPWAVVCFATLAFALGSRGLRDLAISVGVWAVFVVPWTAALSHRAGRLTFGDTGRLTYVWFVNQQDPPAIGGVPPGARTTRAGSLLSGVGVIGDAPGTDPMWYDPARWNAALAPHWDARQQLASLRVFEIFYVQNLTPLLFLALLVLTAPSGTRRFAWRDGWVVYVPAIAGVMAYALVIVTSRYVMPFVLSASLVLLATLPLARRMRPVLAFLGIAIPVGLETLSPETALGLALVASIMGGMIVGVTVRARSWLLWSALVLVGLAITRILVPASVPDILHFGVSILLLLFWWLARRAVGSGRTAHFARRVELAMGLGLGVVLLLRLGLRLQQDTRALAHASSLAWGNVQAHIASDLQSHGVAEGTRIAIIGPHAESYWARTGRLHIVANVPRNRAPDFWQLSPAAQDSLLAQFAGAGATVAIASIGPEHGQLDSSWTPLKYHGWMKRLRQ